jgi:hypothetical protein
MVPMDKLKRVAVVIPFYKEEITAYEAIALQQCERVLGTHPIIAIKPGKLVLPHAVNAAVTFSDTVSFDSHYFDSIAGYNRLMLSAEFYSRFLNYEYILIYQLDAFVFKDELGKWCQQDLDYIGAPWIRPVAYTDFFKAVKSKWQYYFHTRFNVMKNGVPSDKQFENKVGNGGFSLRRVKKFHELCISRKAQIEQYLSHTAHEYNEDAFWSVEVNRKKKVLNIPGYKKALAFAFELAPERALKLNGGQLPFGCHAWDLFPDFWKPFFKQQGYDI